MSTGMSPDRLRPPLQIAIVGAGLMGAGWAACFLAHGHRVVVTDPDPRAGQRLRDQVDRDWPLLRELGEAVESPDHTRLIVASDVTTAVQGADVVQECAPEDLDLKRALFAEMDAAAPADAILASSSSAIPMSLIQQKCRRPERTVIGHPLNPPHIMPLVEVVGGELTSPEFVQRAVAFYRSVGKQPLELDRETPGHVVNRLQAALTREAVQIVLEGVASARTVDAALTTGPGLRSALVGPLVNMHLAGGTGGIEQFIAQFGGLIGGSLPPAAADRLVTSVHEAVAGRTVAELEDERDRWVVRCRQALAEFIRHR